MQYIKYYKKYCFSDSGHVQNDKFIKLLLSRFKLPQALNADEQSVMSWQLSQWHRGCKYAKLSLSIGLLIGLAPPPP